MVAYTVLNLIMTFHHDGLSYWSLTEASAGQYFAYRFPTDISRTLLRLNWSDIASVYGPYRLGIGINGFDGTNSQVLVQMENLTRYIYTFEYSGNPLPIPKGYCLYRQANHSLAKGNLFAVTRDGV